MKNARERIVSFGRKMLEQGLVCGSFGNISCCDGDAILITPTSLDYTLMAPADVVKIDLDGKVLEGDRVPSSEFRLHLAIYHAREEVRAIVHTHSPNAIAFSLARESLPPLSEELSYVTGPVSVSPYRPAGTQELADEAVRTLGTTGKAIILQRHGVVGVGKTLEEAFLQCEIVERGVTIYLASCGLGWSEDLWEGG
jgi:L-fuculose-phosphate aldolase